MQLKHLGERCEFSKQCPGRSPGRKGILEHFSAQKPHLVTSNFLFLLREKNKHHNFGPPRLLLHCGVCGVSS